MSVLISPRYFPYIHVTDNMVKVWSSPAILSFLLVDLSFTQPSIATHTPFLALSILHIFLLRLLSVCYVHLAIQIYRWLSMPSPLRGLGDVTASLPAFFIPFWQRSCFYGGPCWSHYCRHAGKCTYTYLRVLISAIKLCMIFNLVLHLCLHVPKYPLLCMWESGVLLY